MNLSPQQWNVLDILLSTQRPLTEAEITVRLPQTWRSPDSHVVRVHIHHLRARLGRDIIDSGLGSASRGYSITDIGRERLAAMRGQT